MKTPEFEKAKTFNFSSAIEYAEESIVSKTILKREHGNITLFSFDKGQGLSEHTSPFDAVVQVVEGQGAFIIDGKMKTVEEGEMIIMPANIPHDVQAADQPFKMLLTMIRSET